ncbi:C-type lectin-related protein 1 [Plakobranchus ocellatus]|uniref:C-type lectin-related protein 1 n=1 Tax=Plakobranchus ocellatus TaxID=259542 RepID=A0AAV4AD22_9GAST|nr:C-type lectin-related protein 1 [Plakobranchus ocellatus]
MFSIFLAQRETDDSTAYRSGHWISLLPGLLRKPHRFVSIIEYWTTTRNGRKYHLSKQRYPFDIEKMNERCKSLGGYLVELNNKAEQKFVWRVIHAAEAKREIVYTGLTDLGQEGRFYHYHTKKPMARGTYWRRRQPDNYRGKEHCTNLMHWGLNDIDCHRNARYMCETSLK